MEEKNPKIIELKVKPPEKKSNMNDVPQMVVEATQTGLARAFQLPPGVGIVDMRITTRRIGKEKVLQIKIAGMGRPPMAGGKLPITDIATQHMPIPGIPFLFQFQWESGNMLVAHDATPLPIATWPTDGSEICVGAIPTPPEAEDGVEEPHDEKTDS